jgi:hypothetical protein
MKKLIMFLMVMLMTFALSNTVDAASRGRHKGSAGTHVSKGASHHKSGKTHVSKGHKSSRAEKSSI